jgi:hypothetical protein
MMRPNMNADIAALIVSCMAGPKHGTAQPAITSFRIAGGSFNTSERIVKLDIQVNGATPIAYRVSESSDLSGTLWKAFETSPSFRLSAVQGAKILFLQVGAGRKLTTTAPRTSTPPPTLTVGDYVQPPPIVSAVARDTIVLGLPDLTATVQMPVAVRDGDHRLFDFTVIVTNKGQASPPGQVIYLYNSFVLNQLAMENYDVTFGAIRLVGDRCKITDIPTLECTLAPIVHDGAVQFKLTASVTRLLRDGQNESSPTLRTRIYGIAESNMVNNCVDTPLKVIR